MPSAVAHISPYSGSWYPGDPRELEHLLDKLLANSTERTGSYLLPDGLAFVVPHAGLIYSGTVAAAVYRHLRQEQPERILLLGFAHRGAPPGIWIPDIHSFRTPLGEAPADREAMEQLTSHRVFRQMAEMRLCDHSIEIQLPLLQKAAPAARIVPLYVGHLEPPMRQEASQALAEWVQPGTVLLASSDFTHYGKAFHYQPFPEDYQTGEKLRELDFEAIEAAGSLREDLFFDVLRATSATVCGFEPIGLLLATLSLLDREQEIFQETLDYQTSGEITGDFSHSVSYAALGYFPDRSFWLGEKDQALLLESARRTLRQFQETDKRKPIPPKRKTPSLERRSAVFVTLRKGDRLRGCLGRRSTGEPLWKVVPDLTLAAALEDVRFDPVTSTEAGIEVEISVLSPMKRILDTGCFQLNVHGAVLEAGEQHGLLLPQVATERNWSSEQFFEALARKAGVTTEVYSSPSTRLHVFRAQVIH